jgi:cobaltochelatase CobS
MVEIAIPSYGLKVSMSSDVAGIENIFKILDDVLAGNNVYLIGEAGTGKTYTAEKVSEVLNRQKIILNCSQYTSPTEILGGQTIEGYVDGKLIIAWRDGGILILDEMPKLDPNTAGLFNDALAKSSKTRPDKEVSINSANPKAPAITRNANFGVIATGNIYPNAVDMQRYVGNNQQDLSLLDRFSGSVYFVGYSVVNDKTQARYQFLYDLLVGQETDNKKWGFRFFMIDRGYTRYSVLSLRTIIAMRVAFEIELARAFAKKQGKEVVKGGKTLWDAIESFLVAFPAEAKEQMIQRFDLREDAINSKVRLVMDKIVNGGDAGLKSVLTDEVKEKASGIIKELSDFKVAQPIVSK